MQVSFADGLTHISLTGPGLVRLEFGVVAPASGEAGNTSPALRATQQVVMPLEGFLRAFGTQEQVIKKLAADGIVKRRDEASGEAIAAQ